MSARLSVLLLLQVIALSACEPVGVQNPPGSSAQNPVNAPNTSPATPQNPDITGSQRWQHAWSKAMEGIAMGGSLAGPYGAGGGLIIGLITGLITADSHWVMNLLGATSRSVNFGGSFSATITSSPPF